MSGGVGRIIFVVVAIFFVFPYVAVSQTDTLQPPTMMSERLVTLLDFTPDAVYGTSYLDMTNRLTGAMQKKKTIFNRQGSKFILPTLFIAYGVSARFNQLPIRQFDFDFDHEIQKRCKHHNSIDTYFEIATPVLAYGLGFIPGIEAKHNFRDRTLVMATSFLVMESAVKLLKHQVPVLRPRGWGDDSFPSGHMAVAMTGAHIMYKEYKDISPLIGVGGYLMAATTGAYRMFNYAHWLSDVVMAAGIGLLSVEIGYMMLPVWHSIFGIQDDRRSFVAVPTVGYQSLGLGMVYHF